MKSFSAMMKAESRLMMRDFFSVFFALVFPTMMLFLFGTIYKDASADGAPLINQMVPAYCAMVMGVTGLMDLPLTLSSNMDRHIYKRFDATPSGKGLVIGSQLLRCLILTLVGIALLLVFGIAFFDLRISGNPLAIIGSIVLGTASMFALGFLFAAISPNGRITQLLCYISYFCMLFLSGATIPSFLFPAVLQDIAAWLPMTYIVDLLQSVFNAARNGEIGKDILVLVLVVIGSLTIGIAAFRRKDWGRR